MAEKTHPEQSFLADPKMLLADNKSSEAKRHIAGYAAAKTGAGLTEIDGCSDARANVGPFVPRDDVIFRPSIAAAGDRLAFRYVIMHPATIQFIVLQHFDGSTVSKTEPPKGCGGLGVKGQRLAANEQPAEKGILGFVDRKIHHPGVYNQAHLTALQVAEITDKPILAAALDHLTGLIHPFVLLTDKGRTAIASVPFGQFKDASLIYRNGIPDLADKYIPASLLEILKSNRRQVEKLRRTHPGLAVSQKIQDPGAIVMTTSLLPTNLRYPHAFGEVNTNFGIEMPIVKKDGIITGVHQRALETEVLAQLEYPIGNATTAQSGHGGHGFNSTHRIIIETPDMDLSRRIGKTLTALPWIQSWLKLPNNQIWGGVVVSGHTLGMEIIAR